MSEEKRGTIWKDNAIIRQEANSPTEYIFSEFNKAHISGRIENELEYSHEVLQEKFYRARVRVKRPSGTEDLVPIIVSDFLIERKTLKTSLKGKWIEVYGQFRSHNFLGEDGGHLDLFLFVTKINIYDDLEDKNSNLVYLDGYICKPPIFRKTPLGKAIADLFVAVNRPYGKSDYIPCIAWDKVARWVSSFEIGSRVKFYGRIQSREYFKRYSPNSDEGEHRMAYEISITEMENDRK